MGTVHELYTAPMSFQWLNRGVELEGNVFPVCILQNLQSINWIPWKQMFMTMGNVVPKVSAIRHVSGRRHCLKASYLSFGDGIFHLQLLHATVDGFLSSCIWAESELVSVGGIAEL